MSYLDNLNSQLSSLTSQTSSIEASLQTYNQRKKDIEAIIKNLINTVDGSYSSMNIFSAKITDMIYGAIKGSACSSNISASVSSDKEKGSSSDGDIATALSSLRSELSSVNQKINDLNSDIASVNRQINSTKSAISTEKKRIADEEAKEIQEALIAALTGKQ